MKRFIIRLVIFIAILFAVDCMVGFSLSYLLNHCSGGIVGTRNYIVNKCNDDILIFGSSRANHHYNPQIIKDSLGFSCHNCGEDGEGILYYYGLYSIINERYCPKIIVYDVMPIYDYLCEEKNNRIYSGLLKPYYDHTIIREMFEEVDKKEAIKMHCQMYRYNSYFHQIIADNIHPIYNRRKDGFAPLEGEFNTMKINSRNGMIPDNLSIDSIKINYLNKFIDELGGVKIVFTFSPVWYGVNPDGLKPLQIILEQRNISLIDFSNDTKYVHNNEYFIDGSHLNERGADEFTRDLIKEIKRREILSDLGS